ncbi:hypothetical protein [Streptomyces sp. NPDC002785]|uniref:hypothetical protein n=1 Tax=Streptomyces sp. NPDC002785 TaxID=3154543 RepID=UPI00331E59B9
MTHPVSRTILLLDIEKFSDRDDVEQSYLRRMLYDVADRTMLAAGIDETRRQRADRGDSVMELIDADASVPTLLRTLLTDVPAQLRAVNRMASSSAQMRLRAVVAAGYVAVDELNGWVGSDLNHACRLLDASLLRAALRERTDAFALCVSENVYAGIVRHNHLGVPAEEFTAISVPSKNGVLKAWLHGPVPTGPRQDHHEAGDDVPVPERKGEGKSGAGTTAGRPAASRPPSGPQGTGARFGGGLVVGDNHGVSAGTVNGDINFGGTGGRGERG